MTALDIGSVVRIEIHQIRLGRGFVEKAVDL